MASDETMLICDLAETYGVLDWRKIPVRTAAALCAGLKPDSRTKKRLSGFRCDYGIYLLAAIFDQLNVIRWMQTKDGANGTNKPKSLAEIITGGGKDGNKDVKTFRTGADFEAERKRLINGLS